MNFSSKQSKLLIAVMIASQSLIVPLAAMAGPVRIAGQQAFDVITGGSSRTSTIQRNIDNALVATQNRSPSAVGIVYVKGQPVITLGGFYITTIDAASAKAAHTTPSLLAQKWAAGLKATLKDRSSIDSYVAQLTGSGNSNITAGTATTQAGSYPYYKQGHIVYIPAGMNLPVTVTTPISSETAHAGDRVQGQIAENVNLGETVIPQGSVLTGEVTESTAGQRLGRSGTLGIKFNVLHTPDGQNVPITAHIVGGIGKYQEIASGTNIVKGESTETKMKDALVRGAIGAGSGALLGTAIGAIASHGYGTGKGAIAGTAIGGALGVAESLLYRKGSDVKVASGETLNLQLDAPASLAETSGQM